MNGLIQLHKYKLDETMIRLKSLTLNTSFPIFGNVCEIIVMYLHHWSFTE